MCHFDSAPAEYCDERAAMSVCVCVCVCLFVCPRDHIFGTARPIFTKFLVHVTYGRGSVLLWRRSDVLCTSGFMDDVIFAHKSRLLDVAAQLKRSAHAVFGLATNCCAITPDRQRTHGTTFRALKVTFHVATPGAESTVYDCLVWETRFVELLIKRICYILCYRPRL